MAGALPLYGICAKRVPVLRCMSSPTMWLELPTADEAMVMRVG